MRFTYLLMYCSDFLLWPIAAIAVSRYNILDQAAKIICCLTVLTCFTETIALYYSHFYHFNMPVYAVFNIIQMALICVYFNYSIDIFYKKNLGYHFACISIILGILNLIYLQPINSFNSYYLVFESLGIISMSLFSFFRLLLMHEQLRIKYYIHFWIPVCFVFFWSVTFLSWSLHDYIVLFHASPLNILILEALTVIAEIITYSAIGFLFYYYPKMREKC